MILQSYDFFLIIARWADTQVYPYITARFRGVRGRLGCLGFGLFRSSLYDFRHTCSDAQDVCSAWEWCHIDCECVAIRAGRPRPYGC